MKYLIIFLLLLPLISVSQDIPKGAEGIVLKTDLPDSVLFEAIVTHLTDKDFTIDKSDLKRGTISTDNKASSGAMNIRILVTTKQSIATFKAQWSAQLMGYSFTNEPVRNKGMKGSNEKKAFQALNEIVNTLHIKVPDSSIEYLLPVKL